MKQIKKGYKTVPNNCGHLFIENVDKNLISRFKAVLSRKGKTMKGAFVQFMEKIVKVKK